MGFRISNIVQSRGSGDIENQRIGYDWNIKVIIEALEEWFYFSRGAIKPKSIKLKSMGLSIRVEWQIFEDNQKEKI